MQRKTPQKKFKMPLFKDRCKECADHFVIGFELSAERPTRENIQTMYEYFAMMRDFIRTGHLGKHYGMSVIYRSGREWAMPDDDDHPTHAAMAVKTE